ncbi:MAG: MnhB domain-containing protein [Puniceicoccales bacterium]
MKSVILHHSGRLLFPWLIVLSLVVLYRGHNLPGGGFIGGLIAATAFLLASLGDSVQEARKMMRIDPTVLMGVGLAVAILSGLPGVFAGTPFLTGEWLPDFKLPLLGSIHLGTPLVFDIGVYFTVIGFVLHSAFSLSSLSEFDEEDD